MLQGSAALQIAARVIAAVAEDLPPHPIDIAALYKLAKSDAERALRVDELASKVINREVHRAHRKKNELSRPISSP